MFWSVLGEAFNKSLDSLLAVVFSIITVAVFIGAVVLLIIAWTKRWGLAAKIIFTIVIVGIAAVALYYLVQLTVMFWILAQWAS